MQQGPDYVTREISPFIHKISSIEGIEESALVSQDGIIAGKYFDLELNDQWYGTLMATILASYEFSGGIVDMKSLEWVAILEKYTSLMISCAGKKFLIADIFKNRIDPYVHNQMLAVGKTVGEVI